jgi:antitoxin MazE
MKSTLRQIGNSRGIIIPATLLVECDIQDEIELTLENGRLVITPIKPARSGWFDHYQADQDSHAWDGMADIASEQEDWQW